MESPSQLKASALPAPPVELKERRRAPPSTWREYLGVVAVVVVGVLLSLSLAAVVRAREQGGLQQEFERRALTLSSSVQTTFKLLEEVSSGLQSFFSASGGVGLASFQSYVGEALQRHPSLYALEWLELVTQPERARFEAAAREQGLKSFQISQIGEGGSKSAAPERPEYLVVLYMEPAQNKALGFDVLSRESSRVAHERARDTGVTVATDPFTLFEDPEGGQVVALYAPVYRPGAKLDDVPRRRAAMKGQAVGLFRVHEAAVRALSGLDITGVELALVDQQAPVEHRTMFRAGVAAADGELSSVSRFGFGDRIYAVEVRAGPSYFSRANTVAVVVLIVGLLVTALFGFVVFERIRVEKLREQVARALQLGQYSLVRKLGEGGMGVVYLATHAMLRRPTAVKLLRRGLEDAASQQRFEREVQLTARLTHPNTVQIFDYGSTPDGLFYYAMEYLSGINLDELVSEVGPLPEARVAHLLEQVCGALSEAHELGLIHRDIKPSNLMVGVRGGVADVVKVLDFGLVTRVTDGDTSFAGTPAYASPETISGLPIDPRSDLYSLGAVGYYLLTASDVFRGESTVDIIKDHQHTVPESIAARLGRPVHSGLEALILRALAKDPEQRPQSAEAMADELKGLTDLKPWAASDARAWWEMFTLKLVARTPQPAQPVHESIVVDVNQRAGT